MTVSIPNCPKCKQPMRWHSSNQAKSLDGRIETNVYHCEQCDRYLAKPGVSAAA